MASTLSEIRERFPKLLSYPADFIASALYDQNYEDIKNEFDDEEDYIAFLLQQDTTTPETKRFGKYVSLEDQPEEEAGILETIGPSFKKGLMGLEPMARGVAAGVAGEGEFQEEQLRKAQEAELAQAQIIPDYIQSWRDIGGIGDLTRYAIQKFGESSPWMGAALAGGAIGSAALPGLGTVAGMGIGSLIGGTAALTPMFFGQNILRQSQEVREGRKAEIDEITAALSAPAQALLDTILYRFLPPFLKKTTSKGIFRKVLKGGAVGVPVEAATEVGQQFIERMQAGLSLDDEEAMREYEEAAFAGGLLGGVVGGATGPLSIPTVSKVEDELNKQVGDISREQEAEAAEEEALETLELEKEEKPPIVEVAPPVIPVKLSPDKINSLRQEGTEDGKRLFVGAMLTEKIKKITEKDGEEAAREYYDAYQNEFLTARRTPAPRFEEVVKPKKKTGQRRFEIDKIKTDQFEGQEEGFAVRDNKWGGEDSLSYKTEEQAQAELKRREEKFGRLLTKEDTAIPPKPGEVLYTAKDKEVKEGTKKVGEEKTKGFEGFAWDSSKGEWVDIWEGKRGTEEELAPLTIEEKEAAKLTPEGYTEGHIDYDFNLKPSQKKQLFDHRKKTGTRKDKKKYDFTDLQELKRAGVLPNDARFVEKLSKKQRRLLNKRRKEDETFKEDQYNRWFTTERELIERGVISLPEDIKSYVDTQRKENVEQEARDFDTTFDLRPTEDGKFKIFKILKEKGTDNVVQESSYGVFTDEARAGRALRDAQARVGQQPDLTAGGVSITLPELEARDRSPKKILSQTTKFISNIIRQIAGPTTGIRIATETTARPEGSVDLEKTEYAFGDVAAWYDRSSDIIYLSLEHMEKMAGRSESPAEFRVALKQLLSHESFHALQNVMDSMKTDGVLTNIEQKALDESFPEGTVDKLPEPVKKILGDDIMNVLRRRHAKINKKTGKRDDLPKQETLSSREMQAYVFQVWNARNELGLRLPKTGNMIQRAFKKIRNILAKTRRFLTGKGYNTWESIFKAAEEGEIARRAAPKTEAEAKALGERRAKEIAEVEVPTKEIEGKRFIVPEGVDYTIERNTNYPTTSSELKKEINSNNPIFKPLGFRPSSEAIETLNSAAKSIIKAKKFGIAFTQKQALFTESDRQVTDFKNKLISEKPERVNEAVIKEMMQPMVNAAVAENQGHKFNIKDPDIGESITIGRGSELVGKDGKIHKELSDVRINRKPLYRAINEGFFPEREERQVERAEIEEDKKAVVSAERAAKLLEEKEAKPKRPILKLPPKVDYTIAEGYENLSDANKKIYDDWEGSSDGAPSEVQEVLNIEPKVDYTIDTTIKPTPEERKQLREIKSIAEEIAEEEQGDNSFTKQGEKLDKEEWNNYSSELGPLYNYCKACATLVQNKLGGKVIRVKLPFSDPIKNIVEKNQDHYINQLPSGAFVDISGQQFRYPNVIVSKKMSEAMDYVGQDKPKLSEDEYRNSITNAKFKRFIKKAEAKLPTTVTPKVDYTIEKTTAIERKKLSYLDKIIPTEERLAIDTSLTPQDADTFTELSDQDGITTNFDDDFVSGLLDVSVAEVDALTDGRATAAIEKTNYKVPTAKFINDAMKGKGNARYWYEISSEFFKEFTSLLPKNLQRKFIDIVSITSGGINPKGNLRLSIGVMSELYRNVPVRTGFKMQKSLNKYLLADNTIDTQKFGNFTGTMKLLGGLETKIPSTTNDLQVADMFGINASDFIAHPDLYAVTSKFYNKLRDAVNETLPADKQKYQSWQVQALTWVHNSREAGMSDNYLEVSSDIISELESKGHPLEDGKLTTEILSNKDLAADLQTTIREFEAAPKATVEIGTVLTPEGREARDIVNVLSDKEKIVDEYNNIHKSLLKDLIKKIKQKPSLIEELASAIIGKKLQITRMIQGFGTYEGSANLNVRIPLLSKIPTHKQFILNKKFREALLSILGKALNQEAMASSVHSVVPENYVLKGNEKATSKVHVLGKIPTTAQQVELTKDIGQSLNIEPVPGGYVIEINSFDGRIDDNIINDALDKIDPNADGTIWNAVWDGDYTVAKPDEDGNITYEQAIKEIKNEIKTGYYERMGGTKSAENLDDNISSAISKIEKVVAERNEKYKAFIEKHKGKIEKPTEVTEEVEIDRSPTGPNISKELENKPESSIAYGEESGVAYSIDHLANDPSETGIESLMEIDTINSEISSTIAYQPPKWVAKIEKWLDDHPNFKNKAIHWRIRLQDKLYRGKEFLEKIKEITGKAIPDSLNFYVKEERYWGQVKDKINAIRETYFEPINKILKSQKITVDEVGDFLYARHAPERNAKIREGWNSSDPKISDKYKHLSKKESEMGSGMSDEEAQSIMDGVNADPRKDSFEEIGKIVNQMMDLELRAKLDAGLYSEEQTREAKRGAIDPKTGKPTEIKNYIPIAGIDYDIDAKNLVGSGIQIVSPLTKKTHRTPGFSVGKEGSAAIMKGRTTRGQHILAQVRGKLINSIIRSEKNIVAESFFKFAQEYKNLTDGNNNPIFSRAWIVDPKKEDIDQYLRDTEEYSRNKILFLNANRYGPGTLFKFMQNGKERQVLIQDDFLARGLKNLGSESGGLIINMMSTVTRYLAAINTAFNPEFIIGNATRDLGTAGINLTEEATVSFRNEAFKGWFPSLRAAFNVERGKKGKGGKTFRMVNPSGVEQDYTYEDLYNEFKANGGRVGFFQALKGIDVQVQDMLNDVGDISNPKKLLKFIRNNKLLNFIENSNAAVENAIRVSAYRAARMNGVSLDQSISLAKNLTVNFNRKGEWGSIVNAFYIFYNASIQGSVRVMQAAYRSPKVRKMLWGIMAWGFLQDIFNRALAGDDEDGRNRYDKINSYTKSHSLIMWIPGTEKFMAIPIPYGYNAIWTTGQTLASSLPEGIGANKRQLPIGEGVTSLLKTVTDVFNPIGGANSIAEYAAPTVAKPFLQLQDNKDYAGRNIYPPDNPFEGNAGPPDSQRYWSATSISVGAAQMLNRLTGGNNIESGFIDVHPETLEFWVRQGFGGMGSTFMKTTNLPLTFLSGEWSELTPNQIPMARKFLKAPPRFIDKQYFFNLRDEVSIAKDLVEYYREEGDRENLFKVKKERRDILRLDPMIKSVESKRRKIRKMIQKIEENKFMSDTVKEERIRRLKEKENQILVRFIKRADQILE